MKLTNYSFAFILMLLFAVGCGGNPSASGTVKFPDGTPMGSGIIIFESETLQAIGTIQENGSYSVSSGETRGIPNGTYNVFFSGFGPDYAPPDMGPGGNPIGPPKLIRNVELIIPDKYLSPHTSGLVCEVKGRTVFNITVEHR